MCDSNLPIDFVADTDGDDLSAGFLQLARFNQNVSAVVGPSVGHHKHDSRHPLASPRHDLGAHVVQRVSGSGPAGRELELQGR